MPFLLAVPPTRCSNALRHLCAFVRDQLEAAGRLCELVLLRGGLLPGPPSTISDLSSRRRRTTTEGFAPGPAPSPIAPRLRQLDLCEPARDIACLSNPLACQLSPCDGPPGVDPLVEPSGASSEPRRLLSDQAAVRANLELSRLPADHGRTRADCRDPRQAASGAEESSAARRFNPEPPLAGRLRCRKLT